MSSDKKDNSYRSTKHLRPSPLKNQSSTSAPTVEVYTSGASVTAHMDRDGQKRLRIDYQLPDCRAQTQSKCAKKAQARRKR